MATPWVPPYRRIFWGLEAWVWALLAVIAAAITVLVLVALAGPDTPMSGTDQQRCERTVTRRLAGRFEPGSKRWLRDVNRCLGES